MNAGKGDKVAGTAGEKTRRRSIDTNQIYPTLKQRIINCELPPGEPIHEDEFAREFGTSRTPVRESLMQLRNDELVSIVPRKGTFVSQITVQNVYEVYQIRQLLEPDVGATVRGTLDAAKLEEFRDVFRRVCTEEELFQRWFEFDREFHTYIVSGAGNAMLLRLYESIMNHQQRISILSVKQPRRLEHTWREHSRIINALLGDNDQAVRDAITDHITASWEAALRVREITRSS